MMQDLLNRIEDLLMARNLGRKGVEEVVETIKRLTGITIPEERNT